MASVVKWPGLKRGIQILTKSHGYVWDLMGSTGGLMGFNGGLMGFNGDFMGFIKLTQAFQPPPVPFTASRVPR